MESSEYLSFIPLLIYGLAIADLLSEWKRLFDKTQWYFPYLLTTIVLTELAIYNVFIYANLISELEGTSYLSYLKLKRRQPLPIPAAFRASAGRLPTAMPKSVKIGRIKPGISKSATGDWQLMYSEERQAI
jgi:hypothetical protein